MTTWYCRLLLSMTLCSTVLAHPPAPFPESEGLVVRKISEHIYIAHGPQEFPNPQTAGFMNNPGFIVTLDGVVVVDPGSSVQIGRRLLSSIRGITEKPVVAVFNTHVHGDHWLGNQAIRESYPHARIYAHQRMLEHVDAGAGEEWIALFSRLTEGATDGTNVTGPDIGLQGGEVIPIGELSFHIYHTGKAHSDNDIMIELTADSALFTGDIVTNQRIQSARPADSNIFGQIHAVEVALGTNSRWYLPGHGQSGGREIVEQQLLFLQNLLGAVQRYYNQGMNDYEMVEPIKKDLSAYNDWYNFDELGRVIAHIYIEVEEKSFE
ncbi:MAG: MBL fold metallo-hydrolase [gamma proteobacterium symbiont of Ctena orbiculata]|nr:MAG: MBL fold metallo-hydrolase [gamma proteobacterium symbiont of Ctena orbiculata]PUB80852.1 MAG: MBL fold metallo-hydrolase [gamma proteobacterium symbiont of Ctena orbiculata]